LAEVRVGVVVVKRRGKGKSYRYIIKEGELKEGV